MSPSKCHLQFAASSRPERPFPAVADRHRVSVRIAYVTESFPPDVNGVAHTAVRVAEHLISRGHEPLVIAPEPASGVPLPDRRIRLPRRPGALDRRARLSGLRVGLPGSQRPGRRRGPPRRPCAPGRAVRARARAAAPRRCEQDVPIVAVYATDLPAYARTYHAGALGQAIAWRRLRKIHNAADRTLAPCTATAADLHEHGIERVQVWTRGVDCRRFDPAKRSAAAAGRAGARRRGAGRLRGPARGGEARRPAGRRSPTLPGVRLVIVGGGPAEAAIRRAVPSATYLGQRGGENLARIYASLDVFVHSGPHDTFGQTLQEAAASGLPVVAPAAGGPLDLVRDGVTGFLVPTGRRGGAGRRRGSARCRPGAAGGAGPGRAADGARPDLAGACATS